MKSLLSGTLAVLIAGAVLPACSEGGSQPDGAVDAGGDAGLDADGDAGEDAGGDAGVLPDYDPQSSFLLIIPPGTALFTVFCEGRTWQEEYQMQGRVDLAPGAYVLPRAAGPLDGDLVAGVVFGPESAPVQATGAGSFDVVEYYGSWQYIYRQDFLLQNQSYHLDVWIWFESYFWEAGWPAQVTMEGEFAASFTWAQSVIGDGTGWCQDRQGLAFHDLSSMPGVEYRGTTESGDHLLARIRHARACMVAGNTGCEEIDHAELSLGGVQHVIDEPGALIYSAGHHNLDQEYLIILDPPVGETAAVLVETPNLGASEGGALLRLDASLSPLSSDTFVDWQTIWL